MTWQTSLQRGTIDGADQLAVNPPSSHNLQDARQSAQVQQQVNHRLEQLEGAYAAKLGGEPGQLPSAYSINHNVHSQPNVNIIPHVTQSVSQSRSVKTGSERVGGSVANKISIPWPHEHCHIGPERKKVLYDELNHGQWSAGLFATVALQTDQRARGNMLAYCTQLAQDAVDCGFRVAKGAHKVVLESIEDGYLTWHNFEAIDRLRRDCISRVYVNYSNHADQNVFNKSSVSKSPVKTKVCILFNAGTCNHKSDHSNGNIKYTHICSYCVTTGKQYTHAAQNCNKKTTSEGNT